MARSIDIIKEQITAKFMADPAVHRLYGFKGTEIFTEEFPTVCVESILLFVFAFGMWLIETLFDRHRTDIREELAELKPHSLRWYAAKAKAYQVGDSLPTDESGEPISDMYAEIIPKKQIVRFATADEIDGRIHLKVAKYRSEDDHRPEPLQIREIDGLRRYFTQIKDAGVKLAIYSNAPDQMTINMTVYYNAMILHMDTKNAEVDLFGEDNIGLVRDAIEGVLRGLPFNGVCKITDIVDAVRKIKGVDVADATRVQIKTASGNFTDVTGFCIPSSGYVKLAKLNLTLAPYEYGTQL